MGRRRRRYRDRSSMGRSKEVPFLPDEDHRERHARRKAAAAARLDALTTWAGERGLRLAVTNDGHHFTFFVGRTREVFAEWWPSTAKLVVGRRYNRGIHAHDHQQVIRYLTPRRPCVGGAEGGHDARQPRPAAGGQPPGADVPRSDVPHPAG